MAHAVQQGPSRDAEASAREFGRLPYARASFERVAHLAGALAVADHQDIEDALIDAVEVPEEARSISVSLDRVSVPMEEPRLPCVELSLVVNSISPRYISRIFPRLIGRGLFGWRDAQESSGTVAGRLARYGQRCLNHPGERRRRVMALDPGPDICCRTVRQRNRPILHSFRTSKLAGRSARDRKPVYWRESAQAPVTCYLSH
jgi:hypothetical protein